MDQRVKVQRSPKLGLRQWKTIVGPARNNAAPRCRGERRKCSKILIGCCKSCSRIGQPSHPIILESPEWFDAIAARVPGLKVHELYDAAVFCSRAGAC